MKTDNTTTERKRFNVVGTHISDSKDSDFLPQMPNHKIAKVVVDKLNELAEDEEPVFILYDRLKKCGNKDCAISSTALWKMKDGRYICDDCKNEEVGFWPEKGSSSK